MYTVYIYYVYINTHTYILYYIQKLLIYKNNIFFLNIYIHVFVFIHDTYTQYAHI